MKDFNNYDSDFNTNHDEAYLHGFEDIQPDEARVKAQKKNPKKNKKVHIDKIENNSGMGDEAPYSVAREFNWGAFLFNWIWGLKYKKPVLLLIPILCFIPYGFLLSVMLCVWAGIKGNQWAWEEIQYDDEKDFHSAQKLWVRTWFIFFLIFIFFTAPFYIKNRVKFAKLQKQKEIETIIPNYYNFFSTIELNVPKEVYKKTDISDNHSNFLKTSKYIIYWVRPENERTLNNLNYIKEDFEKNKQSLDNKFILYPDLMTLTDSYASIRDLKIDAKCKNETCIDAWLYKACSSGYCIINPSKRKYYKIRAKERVIPKAISLKNKW